MPKLLIQLVTWNGKKYIPYLFDSLRKQMFTDFPGWWREKVGNVENFFDPENPSGAIGYIKNLIPTDGIRSLMGKAGSTIKTTAKNSWEKLKTAAEKNPGITTLSVATFLLPVIAPFYL